MDNIELKLVVKEKLSASLKTIAKEKAASREHLSEEVLERYVADNEDIWTSKVEQIKEKVINRKEHLKKESQQRIKQLNGIQLADKDEFLDLIIIDDIYYNLAIIAEQKKCSLEQLSIQTLSDFADDYKELLEEKDKQKKEKKDKQKHQKVLQREKKALKKGIEKQKRKTGSS